MRYKLGCTFHTFGVAVQGNTEILKYTGNLEMIWGYRQFCIHNVVNAAPGNKYDNILCSDCYLTQCKTNGWLSERGKTPCVMTSLA